MRNARLAALSLSLAAFIACGSPVVAQDEAAEAEKAAAEAAAARGRAAKAEEEARIAEEKARRAKRRALEKDLAAKEDALDAAREGGDREAVARAEAEVRSAAAALAASVAGLAGGRAPGGRPAPRAPFLPAEGLPPLATRTDRGGSDVVDAALEWLSRHQSPGGSWDGDGFDARCAGGKCPGAGGPLFDPGLSGLATLAFLGCGETHKSGRHRAVVHDALKYLKGIQDAEGCFGPRTSNHFTYNHAIAALAMAEAYGLTQSPLFKESAQKGIDFAEQCRNPYLAWRYGVRPQDNDTSVTGWMVMALASGKAAGLVVDEGGFRGAVAWLDKVTEPEFGRVGYTARGNGPARPQELMDRFPADRTESMTAVGILTRILCGAEREDPWVRKGVDLCMTSLPSWDESAGSIDFYYWYFGALATRRVGGDTVLRWKEAIRDAVVLHQRGEADGCARGSWDPVDPWGPDGGRVYSTAINALTSEACFTGRHGKVEVPK